MFFFSNALEFTSNLIAKSKHHCTLRYCRPVYPFHYQSVIGRTFWCKIRLEGVIHNKFTNFAPTQHVLNTHQLHLEIIIFVFFMNSPWNLRRFHLRIGAKLSSSMWRFLNIHSPQPDKALNWSLLKIRFAYS